MKSQITANGQPLCPRCAMKSYMMVSREYRPLVQQWVVYKEEKRHYGLQQCAACGH